MRLPPFAAPATSSRSSTTGGRIGKARPPLSVSPLHSFENPVSSPITRQTLDHVQEEIGYEPPLSQEVKSPAYPQGPVCIYDPHVYLYLEPSHVEALEFDVILNVAREVLNPFLAEDASGTAPGTPRAQPEYIHVPWDHNTNVVDDLLRLCELIDDRVRLNKKVLVHCQCGVSRSASLVVAYGLYKNPQLTVQEAYDAVKFRSRWIGPNMNLIYQLSEFKTKLAK
ncbi:dual specificity phosphatase, partial [Usnea florida]